MNKTTEARHQQATFAIKPLSPAEAAARLEKAKLYQRLYQRARRDMLRKQAAAFTGEVSA